MLSSEHSTSHILEFPEKMCVTQRHNTGNSQLELLSLRHDLQLERRTVQMYRQAALPGQQLYRQSSGQEPNLAYLQTKPGSLTQHLAKDQTC